LPAGPLDRVRFSRKNREIIASAAFVEVHSMNKKVLRKWHRTSAERHYLLDNNLSDDFWTIRLVG
ncbi:MAG TPA: hypothetical protein VK395_03830, partial [Gemmataceae bacterium]|nr:hypothetical protein [Gemmataceae bacterium]